jgi:exonuclease III
MSNQVNNLQIIQWNCNSLINKCDLICNFLEENKPDIMMLNETKCTYELANFNFDHPSYDILIKKRNVNPAGKNTHPTIKVNRAVPMIRHV